MITHDDIVACIVIGIIMLLLIAMSIALLMGKGTWLIAGYNTLDKEEKEQYDRIALCKFIGKYLLSIALLLPVIPVGGIFKIKWLTAVYVAYVLISTIIVIVYCDTGNRFKKSGN